MGTSSTAAAPRDTAARLFEQYGSQLYRFCLGRLRSPEEAEDAVQSTFLRVYKALGKGTAPEYEAAWLYKIAHNVCLSRRDVVGRRRAFETPQDFDEIEYALAAPENHHEELAGLSDALADMPVNLRQAILLREWQGLSYAEIAVAMDTTVSAVETLIFRARKHLATALEPERQRPQRVAGLLAGLLGRFRDLLSVAGSAKVATGAALLAIGAAGVGTAVELQTGNAANGPTRSPTSTVAARIASVPGVPVAVSHATRPTITSAVAAAPAADSTPSATLSAPPPPGPESTPAAPAATPAPAETPPAAATPAVPVPDFPVPTVQTPTATAPLPAAPLPGITTPELTPPAVQTPTVTLPEAPALPTVTLPVSLPGH